MVGLLFVKGASSNPSGAAKIKDHRSGGHFISLSYFRFHHSPDNSTFYLLQ